MIVVVIIGVLAALASIGYSKLGRPRRARARPWRCGRDEQQGAELPAEFASYLPLRADNRSSSPARRGRHRVLSVAANSSTFDSVRTQTTIRRHDPVAAGWSAVGLRPATTGLYCTYLTNAGSAATTPRTSVRLRAHRRQHRAPWSTAWAPATCRPRPAIPTKSSIFALSSCRPRWHLHEGK